MTPAAGSWSTDGLGGGGGGGGGGGDFVDTEGHSNPLLPLTRPVLLTLNPAAARASHFKFTRTTDPGPANHTATTRLQQQTPVQTTETAALAVTPIKGLRGRRDGVANSLPTLGRSLDAANFKSTFTASRSGGGPNGGKGGGTTGRGMSIAAALAQLSLDEIPSDKQVRREGSAPRFFWGLARRERLPSCIGFLLSLLCATGMISWCLLCVRYLRVLCPDFIVCYVAVVSVVVAARP
jgi:hypothetical protein